jgi:protein gp37
MNKTNIPWANYTWNPIVGCSPASEGCANCYASTISKRFHLPWGHAYFLRDRLNHPAKHRKPGRVFICSMADIGHESVKPAWRDAIYQTMLRAPWHTYIILTKRPGPWLRLVPPSTWVGVTIESQQQDWRLERLNTFCAFRHDIRFVSVEPMLGPVSFRHHTFRPDWVISGPETGPKARHCVDAWIDDLSRESPCFFDKRDNFTRREFPA